MGVSKSTFIPVSAVGYFINKEVSDDGNFLIYYFQVSDYLDEYDLEITPEMVLSQFSESDLLNYFLPNLKFTFPSSNNSRFNFLLGVKRFGKYQISYGFRPECFESENGFVPYLRLTLRGLKFLNAYFKDFSKVK